MWNNSHRKLTGDCQKESCTTKAERKTHLELGRNGRDEVRLGFMPQGEDSEEQGDYTGRDPSWEVSSLRQTLGVLILVSNTEKRIPNNDSEIDPKS